MASVAAAQATVRPDLTWQSLEAPHVRVVFEPGLEALARRVVDVAESRRLNRVYRGQDRPTNVLSFSMVDPEALDGLAEAGEPEIMLGDIVLAKETCAREAADKAAAAHPLPPSPPDRM